MSVTTLSSRFDRARKFSRVMAVLFTIGFVVMLAGALSALVFVLFPKTPSGVGFGIGFPYGFSVGFGDLHGWTAFGAMVGVELINVPTVLVLYHMRKLFLCFGRGQVFADQSIAHIRQAGIWMTLFFSGIAAVYLLVLCGLKQGFLGVVTVSHFPNSLPAVAVRFEHAIFTGVPIIIAAYVMEEARRIAAEHAEIV